MREINLDEENKHGLSPIILLRGLFMKDLQNGYIKTLLAVNDHCYRKAA